MVIETILLNGAAGLVVGGVWVAKTIWSGGGHNGNGHLSKADHRDLCEPIKRRLDDWDRRFGEVIRKIDDNHRETVEFILELTAKVGTK